MSSSAQGQGDCPCLAAPKEGLCPQHTMLVCSKKPGLKILAFSQDFVCPFPSWLFSKLFVCLGACRASSDGMQSHGFQWHGGGVSTAAWEAGIWGKGRFQGASAPLVLSPQRLFASCLCFQGLFVLVIEMVCMALLMGEKAKVHHRDDALMMMKCYCNPGQAKRDKSQTGAACPGAPGVSEHLRPRCCTFCCGQWDRGEENSEDKVPKHPECLCLLYMCLASDKPSFCLGSESRGRCSACFAWKNLRIPKEGDALSNVCSQSLPAQIPCSCLQPVLW